MKWMGESYIVEQVVLWRKSQSTKKPEHRSERIENHPLRSLRSLSSCHPSLRRQDPAWRRNSIEAGTRVMVCTDHAVNLLASNTKPTFDLHNQAPSGMRPVTLFLPEMDARLFSRQSEQVNL